MSTDTAHAEPAIALVRYLDAVSEVPRIGLAAGSRYRPLSASELGAAELNAFLADPDWTRLRNLAAETPDAQWAELSEVTLSAPITPRQVIQAGANYRTHVIDLVVAGLAEDDPRTEEEARAWAAEMMDQRAAHGEPYFFIGLPGCVVGPEEPLVLPHWSKAVDWELELAVVIGRAAYRVSVDEAMGHVAGYTIINDITARDFVFRKDMKEIGTDWYRGKNAPGFLPAGPLLVPADQIDHRDLNVRLGLNGTVMQNGHTSDLLFDVPRLVAAASQTMPLLPGDVLLTGSPEGNGVHHGRLLKDGDEMTGTITGLGTQRVRCIDEKNEDVAGSEES